MRSKIRSLFTLGILTAVLPFQFFAFPPEIKTIIFIVLGILITFITYRLHVELSEGSKEAARKRGVVADTFVESGAPSMKDSLEKNAAQ